MQRAGKFTVAELRVPGLGGCEGGEAVGTKSRKGPASRCPPHSACQGACFVLSFGQALESDEYTSVVSTSPR